MRTRTRTHEGLTPCEVNQQAKPFKEVVKKTAKKKRTTVIKKK